MDWQLPQEDAVLEKVWRTMWGRHLLLFVGYLLVFLALYFRMQHRIADSDIFFWEQRILSRRLLLVMGLHLAAIVGFNRQVWTYHWKQFFFAAASPYNLALVRILFFATMLVDFVFVAPIDWQPLAGLPATARQPLPFVGWMIEAIPISPSLYATATVLAIAFGMLAVLGIFTRPAMIAMIPLVFYLYGVPQFFGKMSHYQFFLWITVILAFSPCFEVWSIESILKRVRGMRTARQAHFHYALALRWLMLSMAGIYFFSGFRKLYEAGLFWSVSDNPVNLLRTEWLEQFRDVPVLRVDHWPILCSVAASGVILFELSYPFLLLGRRGRLFLALDAILFHNLNGYFLKIDFVYLKTAHLSYLNWGVIRNWVAKRKRWASWLGIIALTIIGGRFVGVFFLFPYFVLGALIDLGWHAVSPMKRGRWLLRFRKLLPNPTPKVIVVQRQKRWLKWSFVTGSSLVILNTTCGAFGIHSWPFSAYPTYSFVRGSTMEYGWFLPTTASGVQLDLDKEAQAIHFRKENILPMAERIVDAWKYSPEKIESTVLNCWLRWQTELPTLKQATHVKVVIRSYPLDPDRYGELVKETQLGDLELQSGAWIFVPVPSNRTPNSAQ